MKVGGVNRTGDESWEERRERERERGDRRGREIKAGENCITLHILLLSTIYNSWLIWLTNTKY